MHRRRFAAFPLIALFLPGCEQPLERTPEGYVEACHGGRTNAKKNWVCSDQRVVIQVRGAEADWPRLARIVSEFGRTRSYRVFDTSSNIPDYVRTVGISVCSEDGLFLMLDKRIFAKGENDGEGDRITTVLRTYDPTFEWKPVAEDLVSTFKTQWHGPVEVTWPDPLGPQRALPDSVESCES
jgi:hypothetical protein